MTKPKRDAKLEAAAEAAPDILDTEWDLMQVLWRKQRITAREAADELAERRGWAYSTVKTMLDRMVGKGLVAARQVGSVWEYSPAIPRSQALWSSWRRFVDKAFDGATAPALQFLAGNSRLTKKERETFRKMLDNLEDEP